MFAILLLIIIVEAIQQLILFCMLFYKKLTCTTKKLQILAHIDTAVKLYVEDFYFHGL